MARIVGFFLLFISIFGLVIGTNKLTILSLMPLSSSNGATTMPACLASMRAVVNVVNSRRDILPDYQLSVVPQDEGPGANFGPKTLFRFLDQFNKERDNETFLSPISLGPTIACQTTALSLKASRLVAFSELCNGPLIVARHNQYSNLYRFTWPGDTAFPAVVLFMTSIGAWKQTAIVTSSSNPNDVQSAMILQKVAIQSGIDVLHFGIDNGEWADETFATLKASGARIIVNVFSAMPMCVVFLCRAYQFGIRAPQYLILSQFTCYFPLNNRNAIPLPNDCNWSMVLEQLRITIFYGLYRGTTQTTSPTSLGYDAVWFNKKVDDLLNNTKAPDDDARSMCHDVTMAAILALNRTESILQQNYNNSLRDFSNNKNADLVFSLANASAALTDVVGLRVGRIRYTSALEVERDQLWIAQQLLSDGSLKFTHAIERRDNRANYQTIDAFRITQLAELSWTTKSGKAPKDLSNVTPLFDLGPLSALASLTAASGLVTLVQVVQGFFIFRAGFANNLGPFFDVNIKALVYLGCFALNLACVVLVVGGVYFPNAECQLKIVLTTIAVTLIDSVLVVFLFNYSRLLRRKIRHLKTWRLDYSPKARRSFYFGIAILVVVFAVFLAIWLGQVDPVAVEYRQSPVTFDTESDSYQQTIRPQCVSKNQSYWLAALVAAHSFLLFAGCYFAYELEHFANKPKELAVELKLLKIAIANVTGIFVATLLILLIFVLNQRPMWQVNVILASADLILSLSTTMILYYPAHHRRQLSEADGASTLTKNGSLAMEELGMKSLPSTLLDNNRNQKSYSTSVAHKQ